MPTYEISPRSTAEHRCGHLTLLIDGRNTDYTVDPAQFVKTGLRLAHASQEDGGEALLPGSPDSLLFVDDYCQQRARHTLNRIVSRIQKGYLFPAGTPIGPGGSLAPEALGRVPKKLRHAREVEAVSAFLQRGYFSRWRYENPATGKGFVTERPLSPLSPFILQHGYQLVAQTPISEDERAALKQARDSRKNDAAAEWKANRQALIAARKKELASVDDYLSQGPPADSAELRLYSRQLVRKKNLEAELTALQLGIVSATHGFQYGYGQYIQGTVDLVNDDIRVVPCMTNSDAIADRDAKDTVSDFSPLDEFDGSGYSTGGQALDNQAVGIDDANNRAEFTADDEAATLGAGTRSIAGNLLIKWITDLNSSLPLHWLEYASPKTPDGSLFTIDFNAEGILQVADG